MENTISKSDLFNMVAVMVVGIFANPASGNLSYDNHQRQQIIQSVFIDTQGAVVAAGLNIVDKYDQ